MTKQNYSQNILGNGIRAHRSSEGSINYNLFKNPIIHKQVDGRVIVPLDLDKLWGR